MSHSNHLQRATKSNCRDLCPEWSSVPRFWQHQGEKLHHFLELVHTNPVPIPDRLIIVQIPLKNNAQLTLIGVYAPTMQRSEVEKKFLWEATWMYCQSQSRQRSSSRWLQHSCWERLEVLSVIGKHGKGKMNSKGLMLLEFCTRFQLSRMGTMFQLKNHLKNTWQHLCSCASWWKSQRIYQMWQRLIVQHVALLIINSSLPNAALWSRRDGLNHPHCQTPH